MKHFRGSVLLCFGAAGLGIIFGGLPAAAQEAQKDAPNAPQEKAESEPINADRPGIADSSAVIGPRRFQIEIGYQNEFHETDGTTQRLVYVPLLLRFGISEKWEVRLEGNTRNYSRVPASGSPFMGTAGFSPLSAGFKYHFQDQNAVGKKASLAAIVRFYPASGSSDFQTHHLAADARLTADWDFTPNLSLNPNVGFGVYEDGNGDGFAAGLFAVTLNYTNRAKTINPFLDMGLQGPEQNHGKTALTLDAGVAFLVGKNIQLDFSVGTGVAGYTTAHPFLSGGASMRF